MGQRKPLTSAETADAGVDTLGGSRGLELNAHAAREAARITVEAD
jgi:hypothetical protein